MENINYENIKKYIERNKESHLYLDEIITNKEIQKEILTEYLSKNNLENIENILGNITSELVRTQLGDTEIIEYQSISDDDLLQNCDNLYIYNNGKYNPIFSICKIDNIGDKTKTIYEEIKIHDSNRKIVFQVKSSSKYIYDSIVQRQICTTEKSFVSSDYIKKYYDFLYHEDECFMLTVNNDSIVKGNDSFSNRLNLALSHIQKLEAIFESYVESSIGIETPTKYYQIKRKIK